jgi:hypothetical protein
VVPAGVFVFGRAFQTGLLMHRAGDLTVRRQVGWTETVGRGIRLFATVGQQHFTWKPAGFVEFEPSAIAGPAPCTTGATRPPGLQGRFVASLISGGE